MIDFRYHLVSIVAIFLALGLGIVLGSTALQGPVLSGLETASNHQKTRIDQLYASNQQLRRQQAGSEQFAREAAPHLLPGLLPGQRVVLVDAPGAPGPVIDGTVSALHQAGAVVSGQVKLQPKFFDASSATQETLGQLAQSLAPAGLTLRPGSAQNQASQVLAHAIVTTDVAGQPPAGQRDTGGLAVLNGLAAGGFLNVSGRPAVRATLAVVVIPGTPPSTSDSDARSQAVVTLAQQLNLAGLGTVVAGSVAGSGPGSAIDVMRTTGRSGHLSSVDNADTEVGQVVVAMALAEQLRGVSGNYGTAPTASGALPSPVPTPSPSATSLSTAVPRPARSGQPTPQATGGAR